jgi:2',3'-cyclic-nucleotide 2'-phosphodiesterase (5'-nucleotidase family)
MRTQVTGAGVNAGRSRVGLVGFIVIALLVALMPPPASAQVGGFPDVRPTNVHAEAIAELAAAGILLGYPDGTFRPAAEITRGQLAAVIARAAELPPIRPAGFTDTAGNPHEGAIGALADAGIIFGYEDGSFRPYQPITREHVAVVIGRWLGVEPVVSGPFVDVNRYAGQINALWELGIVAGTTETTFSPLRNIRRDQTASLVYRSLLAMDRDTDFLLTILHINDGESALLPDPRGFPVPFPGAARFVADLTAHQAVAATPPFEEYQPDLGVMTISAGDNYLAGPRLNASRETEGAFYDALIYTHSGFDAMTMGNHEFDFGPDLLADFIEATGDIPFLSANLDFSGEPRLAELEDEGRIAASTVVTKNGRDIGIIGATYEDLDSISSPGDVVAGEVLSAVQAEADRLTTDGVDIIILSSHLQDITTEVGLVPHLTNVDAVVGGGGGEALGDDYPLTATDADGKTVPIVTVPGNYTDVGKLVLHFDEDGELLRVGDGSALVPVPLDGPKDPFILENVEGPVADYVAELASNVIAETEVPLDGRRQNPGVRDRETNLGNLMADAHLEAARAWSADNPSVPEADVALQNGGGMRSDTVHQPGDITELDTFNIAAFSNFVAVGEIDGAALHEALEHSVAALPGAAGSHGQWAGITFNFDVDEPVGSRIVDAIVTRGDGDPSTDTVLVEDGVLVAGAVTFVIASIDFILRDGGDGYDSLDIGSAIMTTTITYQQSLADKFADLGTVTAADYPDVSVNTSAYTRFGPSDLFSVD